MASIGIPAVIIGKDQILERLSGVPCVAIPCQTMAGDCTVEVNIKPSA